MKHARLTAIAVTAVCALGAIVFAQSTPAFQPPRTPDGKPDFTGIYQWPTYLPGQERGRSAATVFDRKYFAPLKPGGENFIEPRTGDPHHDEPRDFCLPAGFPGSILSGNAMQWFQTKAYLVIVHEFQRNTRIVPLDGRPHSDALHTVERIRWKSKTALSYDLTIDDPKIFTKPWSQEFEIVAKPEWDKDGLVEYVCDNNRCPGGKCGDK